MEGSKSLTFNSNRYYSYILGIVLVVHLIFIFAVDKSFTPKKLTKDSEQQSFKVVTIGVDDPTKKKIIVPEVQTRAAQASPKKSLSLEDLNLATQPIAKPQVRPGTMPQFQGKQSSDNKIVFNKQELKKMVQETYAGQTNDLIARDKVSLSYEIPNGKKLGELNEAELRLYSFFRRGAQKYTSSVMTELNSFNLKNPHLQFPMTETKQVMTGRLTYDSEGNLKQIKMVRWTNVDKLQGFFEEVVKRMDTLQNPPKELWEEHGEFTVFVTLQINE